MTSYSTWHEPTQYDYRSGPYQSQTTWTYGGTSADPIITFANGNWVPAPAPPTLELPQFDSEIIREFVRMVQDRQAQAAAPPTGPELEKGRAIDLGL